MAGPHLQNGQARLARSQAHPELADYALKRLPSGAWRYSAPAGAHDDTVIATALAWHGAQYSTLKLIDFA